LWVRNIPVDGEEYKWIYERKYIWTAEKDMYTIDHRSHRKDHVFESRSGLNFFQVLISQLLKLCA